MASLVGKMLKFSIIIPVYNVKEYLVECLNSVIVQSYKQYQVIMVDDGSTDESGEICDKYAEKYENFIVIHKENGGLSSARNRGIEVSTGEYLLFLDSDDYFTDPEMLEKLSNQINRFNPELLVYQFENIQMKSGEKRRVENNLSDSINREDLSGADFLREVLKVKPKYGWFPWLYGIKRDFWIKNNFAFNENIRYFEDIDLVYKFILAAKKMRVVELPFYGYREKREGALTTTSKDMLGDLLYVTRNNILTVQEMHLENTLTNKLLDNFAHFFHMSCILVNGLHGEEKVEIVKMLEENKWVIKFSLHGQDYVLSKICGILGVRVVIELLGLRAKMQRFIDKK